MPLIPVFLGKESELGIGHRCHIEACRFPFESRALGDAEETSVASGALRGRSEDHAVLMTQVAKAALIRLQHTEVQLDAARV